jgi:hypothetical protein
LIATVLVAAATQGWGLLLGALGFIAYSDNKEVFIIPGLLAGGIQLVD